MELEDKVVVVTGASRGLGRALVRAFAEQGSIVVGIGRTLESLEETGRGIDPERFHPYAADVGRIDEVGVAFEAIAATLHRVDVLFNNAAVYPKVSFLEESPEEWQDSIATNVNGIAFCCKAVLPMMIEAEFGRIYNLGSWADLGPIRKSAAYSTSKGAVHPLTKAIAIDIKDLGLDIEVHEWLPGVLNTQMSDFTGIDPAISAGWAVDMVKHQRPTSRNTIFEADRERVPPKRIKDRIMFWRS